MPGTTCPKCAADKPVHRGYCKSCQAAWNRAYRETHPDYFKKYYRSEQYRAGSRKRGAERRDDPEYRAKLAARQKRTLASPEYKAKRQTYDARRDPEKLKAYRKTYWSRPENLARQRERAAKRRADPVKHAALRERQRLWKRNNPNYGRDNLSDLRIRMSNAIRRCIRHKHGSSWLNLVGYTTAELCQHLERQFVRGMGWHNMPKWHIDHIIPLASFKFESAHDPEFKAAWALTNLRPVWAKENLRKNAKREFLV